MSKFTPKKLSSAFTYADETATEAGRSNGGWVRLAKVAGSAPEPYVVAARKTASGVQFACSCAHWKFRLSKTGELCKHQEAFLNAGESPKGKHKVWYFKAGQSFATVLAAA